MRTLILRATSTKYRLHPFNRRFNRPHPKARLSATLAAEKRAHVCQSGVRNVQHHLEWPESKNVDSETPREPSGVAQIPQNLSNRFPSELHRSIGHEDMNRRVGIPYVEFRIEQPEFFRIVTDRSYVDARLSRLAACRLLNPTPNATTHSAFIVE
jgi:hypothetical protein